MNDLQKQTVKYGKISDSIRKIGLVFLFLFFSFGLTKIQGTNSYFTDTATIKGITFTAVTWPSQSAIVINEIMWMGSFGDEKDEWIELRNMTDEDVDLSGWRILNGGSGSGLGSHLQIPDGYTIKANGYFLIAKKKWDKTKINLSKDLEKNEGMTNAAGMDLKDSGEELTLEDKEKNAIDTAWKDDHCWPDGWHGIFLHMSMERDDDPGEGGSAPSWHTCFDGRCNSKEYWDHEGFNFGTPGKKNLSDANRSLDDFGNSEEKILDEITKDIGTLGEVESPEMPDLKINIPELPDVSPVILPPVSKEEAAVNVPIPPTGGMDAPKDDEKMP